MQRFQIDRRLGRHRFTAEYVSCLSQQLLLSVGDLVGVKVELLRQLDQRLVAAYGGQCHFGLEGGQVSTARSSAHQCSNLSGRCPRLWEQISHSSPCLNFRVRLYRRTHNLRAVQLLFGHTKLESTVRYLGIEVEGALVLSEETEV